MTPRDHKREWLLAKTQRTLKGRKPTEWAAAIAGLHCGRLCRLLAANIVWWDYFAKKPASPHDGTLDGYKNDWEYMVVRRKPIRVRKQSLARALIALGYAEPVANKRAEVIV